MIGGFAVRFVYLIIYGQAMRQGYSPSEQCDKCEDADESASNTK